MAMEMRQQIKMTQQLVMTPQLQQAIKLLQMTRAELQDVVSQELEEIRFWKRCRKPRNLPSTSRPRSFQT